MANVKDLRKRIKAVKNTEKITKAMKMVAASKLRRAQEAIVQARPYATRMDEVLADIVNHADVSAHPLLALRKPRRVMLVVMTSNRGLCGGFNSTIIRAAERYIRENSGTFDEIQLGTIGRKGRDHFIRRGADLKERWEDVWDDLTYDQATGIATDLAEHFNHASLDAVYLLYNEFKTAITQTVRLKQLLPIRPLDGWEDDPKVSVGAMAAASDLKIVATEETDTPRGDDWNPSEVLEVESEGFDLVYEPNRTAVLDTLLPQHMAVQIWRALLESVASEHGARMSAMGAASKNAKDLNARLTLQMNRMRQAAITTELSEIVSGAESLKG